MKWWPFRRREVQRVGTPVNELRFGQMCRTVPGDPARYIGDGKAIYFGPICIECGEAAPPDGEEANHPLPSDTALVGWKAWTTGEVVIIGDADREIMDRRG